MSGAGLGEVRPGGVGRGGVRPVRLRLPATSANLGPGFDAVGLAMGMYLTVEAGVSASGRMEIAATGRDAAVCGSVADNLILTTYAEVLGGLGVAAPALGLRIGNEIPLGMGCGSSAAALLAGVLLANHFGELGWTEGQVLEEACAREGHPDNVAACFCGGMTVSQRRLGAGRVEAATFGRGLRWRLLLALPRAGLATREARAVLPGMYSRSDAVENVQATAMLVAAFALGRGDLLGGAMVRDRMHQPYRAEMCPLLPALLPLASEEGVLGVALSGAGPAVLVVVEETAERVESAVRAAAGDLLGEVVWTGIAGGYEMGAGG